MKKYYYWIGIAVAVGVAYWFMRRNPTVAAAAAVAAESPSVYVENSLPSLPQPKSQGTSILRPDIAIGTLGINVPRPPTLQRRSMRVMGG